MFEISFSFFCDEISYKKSHNLFCQYLSKKLAVALQAPAFSRKEMGSFVFMVPFLLYGSKKYGLASHEPQEKET